MTHERVPRRIDGRISVQLVGEETLIYDESRHKAFCLNRASAMVWDLCDGVHTEAQIIEAANLDCDPHLSGELVRFALDQLREDGLLQVVAGTAPQISRREMVEKLGARALVMLPLVAAVLVPEAVQALSGVVDGDKSSQSRASRQRRQSSSNEPSKSDLW